MLEIIAALQVSWMSCQLSWIARQLDKEWPSGPLDILLGTEF